MIGTQRFGVGGSIDSIPNIGPQAPLKIIAFFEHRKFLKIRSEIPLCGTENNMSGWHFVNYFWKLYECTNR